MARTVEVLEKHRTKKVKPKIPEMLGGVEVAEILAVAPSNLQFIKDLPEPYAVGPVDPKSGERKHLKCGKLWLHSEIQEFAKVYAARRSSRKAA